MRPLATTVCLLLATTAIAADPLELKKDDHICFVGNTLADRMQHHGWLETLLVSRAARKDLVFRNLGFSGDEITTRLRSDNFGSPDEWLAKCKADVIFAFFGFNESFAGEAGVPKFKQDLDAWIKHTLGQKYNGESVPRLIVFSPIAHEDLDDPNQPRGAENNARLKLYTAAMAEVAAANGVPFIDLFTPTSEGYASDSKPWTFNGIHLTEYGDQRLARSSSVPSFRMVPSSSAMPPNWNASAPRSTKRTSSGTLATARLMATTSMAAARRSNMSRASAARRSRISSSCRRK
jgi:lysophospholipase L1-like esterase